MLKLLAEHPEALLKAAPGEIPCDTVFTNARILNMFTGKVLYGDEYGCEGFIAHAEYDHPETIDVPMKETVGCGTCSHGCTGNQDVGSRHDRSCSSGICSGFSSEKSALQ